MILMMMMMMMMVMMMVMMMLLMVMMMVLSEGVVRHGTLMNEVFSLLMEDDDGSRLSRYCKTWAFSRKLP